MDDNILTVPSLVSYFSNISIEDKLTTVFCSLVITLVITLLGLGVTKIIVGSMNLQNCGAETMVPVWLIVSGVTPLLYSGFSRHRGNDDTKHSICGAVYIVISIVFNIAWVICGSLWIYPVFGKVMADDFLSCKGNGTIECTHGDCNNSLITFAFSMVTVDWIFIVFWVSLIGYLLYSHKKSKQ